MVIPSLKIVTPPVITAQPSHKLGVKSCSRGLFVNVINFSSRNCEDHMAQENPFGLPRLWPLVKGLPHWNEDTVPSRKGKTFLWLRRQKNSLHSVKTKTPEECKDGVCPDPASPAPPGSSQLTRVRHVGGNPALSARNCPEASGK